MKKLIATLLLLAASSSLVLAQGMPTIGIYDDANYTICYGNISQYVTKTVYFAAWLPPEIPSMTACEFAVSGLPGPAEAILTPTWTTTLVIGTLDYDLALAWTNPQVGPWVLLGTLAIFPLAAFPMDDLMTVVPGQACLCLTIVDGDFVEHDAAGGMYTFNCSDPAGCLCFEETATEDLNWGSLKSLY